MPAPEVTYPLQGGCACGQIRYELLASPLAIVVCHCTECQIQTGSAFAINGQIEHFNIKHTKGEPEYSSIPAGSGPGQPVVARCSTCQTMIWSRYQSSPPGIHILKVATLDKDVSGKDAWKGHFEPGVHIFTTTKVPWFIIPEDALAFEGYYERKDVWSEESMARLAKLVEGIEQGKDSQAEI